MHHTEHFVGQTQVLRTPAPLNPSCILDNSALKALVATKPVAPRRFTLDDPVEHFFEAILGNCSTHIRLLFRVDGTE